MPLWYFARRTNSSAVWMASSRVGERTRTCVARLSGSTRASAGTANAAVVPVPDPYFSHRPVAFILTRAGKTLDRNQLQAELANHLERFKIPQAFLPWPAALSDSPKPPRSRLAELAAISLRA